MTTEIQLTTAIYTLAATLRTAEDFRQVCRVQVFPTPGETRLTIEVDCHPASVVDEFLNYALALSAQEQLG